MKYLGSILLCILLLLAVGCSKKVVVIKASPAETGRSQTIDASKANIQASNNHLEQAKMAYARKKFKQAQKHCEKAIEFNHRNWEAHYYLGLSLQKRREYTVAIEQFGVCLKYSPKNNYLKSEIHYAIGVSWEELGDYKNAEQSYGKALAFNPENKMAQKAKNRIKIDKTMKGWGNRKKTRGEG